MDNGILAHLPRNHPWGKCIQCYDSVPSTNTLARRLAAEGAPEGTVVIAHHQSAGRGRLGRQFHSPAHAGLYLSLLLRPECPPEQLMHLTCAAAVAACDAVEAATGFRPGIKWINDLIAGNKKLGGILTELSISPKTRLVDYAVIGIGINCLRQQFPDALRDIACDLETVTGVPVDREVLAAKLIQSFHQLNLMDKAAIMDRYTHDCVTLGKKITVIQSDTRRNGTALSLDRDGGLTVAFEDGSISTVCAGEVSVRGLLGYL